MTLERHISPSENFHYSGRGSYQFNLRVQSNNDIKRVKLAAPE